jgi:hypothetical protein
VQTVKGLVDDLRRRHAVGTRPFRMADDREAERPAEDEQDAETQQAFVWPR